MCDEQVLNPQTILLSCWNKGYKNDKYTYCMEQSPSWKANSLAHSIQNSPWKANQPAASQATVAFYGTQSFITTFTSALHLSLSWASSIQSIPLHPTSWRSILILSSHLCLGLCSGLFPSDFPTKTLYTPLPSPLHATCPARLILDFITRTVLGEQYRSLSYLCSFLHSPVTLSLLVPNILHNTLFSNTLSLHSSFNVSDQVSHPYEMRQSWCWWHAWEAWWVLWFCVWRNRGASTLILFIPCIVMVIIYTDKCFVKFKKKITGYQYT
jgi:hypothetical protein